MAKGVLVDLTRCIGCGSCAVACKLHNGLEWDPEKPVIDEKAVLAGENWTMITSHVVAVKDREVWRFVKHQCLHCLEPACASSCFVSALRKTPEGPVVYNEDICVGCRYCMLACPFGVPKYEWDQQFPRVQKCNMCFSRVNAGQVTACTVVCPTQALRFGERDALLAEARRRIADNHAYVPAVYGEKEYGGTSWLYISDVPFEQMGFKTNVSERSIPSYTWSVLKWTPYIAVGWTAALTALYLYTKRRAEVEEDH